VDSTPELAALRTRVATAATAIDEHGLVLMLTLDVGFERERQEPQPDPGHQSTAA
jgi:hypothetical protein